MLRTCGSAGIVALLAVMLCLLAGEADARKRSKGRSATAVAGAVILFGDGQGGSCGIVWQGGVPVVVAASGGNAERCRAACQRRTGRACAVR